MWKFPVQENFCFKLFIMFFLRILRFLCFFYFGLISVGFCAFFEEFCGFLFKTFDSIWVALFFSLWNQNHLSFQLRKAEGGMFYQLHIYERGRDSLRSIFMGKGSAKRLLFNVEELISRQSNE